MVTPSPRFYLLYGREDFLKKEFVQHLRARLFQSADRANVQEFVAGQCPLSEVLDFLRSVPFLSECRLAVLWSLEALNEDEKTALPAHLDRLPQTAVLALSTAESSLVKNAFLKALSRRVQSVACHTPFEKDLPRWIQARLKNRNIRIEEEAVHGLIERFGTDLALLAQALEGISVFVHPRTGVALKDVTDLFGKSLSADVFDLLDAALEKDAASVFRILRRLAAEGTRAFEIVPALAGQLERLRRGAALLKEGRTPSELTAQLRIRPFFASQFLDQLKRISLDKIQAMLAQLLLCEEKIKSGVWEESAALEWFFWEGLEVTPQAG